jgi:hypothetical protein
VGVVYLIGLRLASIVGAEIDGPGDDFAWRWRCLSLSRLSKIWGQKTQGLALNNVLVHVCTDLATLFRRLYLTSWSISLPIPNFLRTEPLRKQITPV